jgi:hypothetical protein
LQSLGEEKIAPLRLDKAPPRRSAAEEDATLLTLLSRLHRKLRAGA